MINLFAQVISGRTFELWMCMMNSFETKHLPVEQDYVSLDELDVRVLLGLEGGGFAHFEIAPGEHLL